MIPLTALFLLVLGAETKAETHYPGATAVFQCKFDSSQDEGIYGWPPGWTRRLGPGFPRYIRVRMGENHPPSGGRCLRVELNGGAATAYGPAIAVRPDLQYVLEGYVETSGLQNDGAYLSLTFLDAARTKLGNTTSEKMSGSRAWQRIRLGPVSPPTGASSILIGLHVEPQAEAEDLRGTASFGGLWLGQVPYIELTAQPAREVPAEQEEPGRNRADGKQLPKRSSNDASILLFPRGRPIEIACVVSGFAARSYEIRLELVDLGGRKVAEQRQSFSQHALARMIWRLPGDAVGFYRVRATVTPPTPSPPSSSPAADPVAAPTAGAELSLAIIEPQTQPSGSEFGWSLSLNDAKVGLTPLGELLCQCGIGWVKFPFAVKEIAVGPAGDTSKEKTENSLEPLINFCDRLGTAGVSLAGVLQPRCLAGDRAGTSNDLFAAEAFSRDPKTWYPSIEPILAHLATQIRFWQIGDDHDPGWIACGDLPGIVSRTKVELDRIGQDLDIGIAWNLAAPLPTGTPSPAADRSGAKAPSARAGGSNRQTSATMGTSYPHFLSLPCDDTMGEDAIGEYLDNTKSLGVSRWILVETLPREGHATPDRIVHLVDRMLTAKIHGAEGIFVSDPFDPERGLVDHNGSPSELFLPWRTTALMLGGASYLGDIDLPQGNQLHCFGRKGEYVGVLAGRKPCEETVFLGPKLRMYNLWGNNRTCPPTISKVNEPAGVSPTPGKADSSPLGLAVPAPRSVIPVQQLPTFLVGIDGPVTLWQLGVVFSPNRLPSVPTAIVPIRLKLKNTFAQPISARVTIEGPQNWLIDPRTSEFRLEPGASWQQPLDVSLPNDVVGGRQNVRLDFEIQADRLYRFTMVRPLEVALADVMFAGKAVLNNRGEMEVQQTLTNLGQKPAGFRCDLLVPDRQRQSTEVLLQPSGKNELTYRLPDGKQLLGKPIWLRAEEIDGPRVLNYRIETPTAATPATVPLEEPKRRQPARPGSSLVL